MPNAGTLFYLAAANTAVRKPQRSLLFQIAVSLDARVLARCAANSIRFLRTACKRGAGNSFLRLVDTRHIMKHAVCCTSNFLYVKRADNKWPATVVKIMSPYTILVGPGWRSWYSDSLLAGRSGDRIPVGARFCAPVQTGPGAHPAFYTTGTGFLAGS